MRSIESEAQQALMGDPHTGDDSWRYRSDLEQLRSWGVNLAPCDLSNVPVAFRGAAPPTDPRLSSTPFAFRDPVPATPPIHPPAPQRTNYKPRERTDVYTAWAQKLMDEWLCDHWGPDFMRNYEFHLPGGLHGPIELEQYLKEWRRWNTPLCLGEHARVNEAQGIIWDFRAKHPDGYYEPLDFTAPLDTHLNTDFLRAKLGFTRDRGMLSQLCDVGVVFDADVELQTLIFPHLIDLPPGYRQCDKEIKRRASSECNYCQIHNQMGFSPWRTQMQGSVARAKEPLRPRMKADAGAPRKPPRPGKFVQLRDAAVVSLNDAIGGKTELPGEYPYENDQIVTTGALGAESVPRRRKSKRPHTRLPPEIKPYLSDIMHDTMVLRYACDIFGLKLVALADDFKDMFNQFKLATWELWKVGFPWIFVDDLEEDRADIKFVHETTLGFGYENASNFAQRVGWAITEYVAREMDIQDLDFFNDSPCMTPEQLAWIADRKQASEASGENELRLFSVRHIFTDDPMMLVANDARGERLTKLISVWTKFVRMARFRMAIASKRQLGAAVTWGGIYHIPHLCLHIIPQDKVSRAAATLAQVVDRDPSLTYREYRSLMGLLEHLNPFANGLRDAFAGMYVIHQHADANNFGPTEYVADLIDDIIVERAANWRERLIQQPATYSFSVFTRDNVAPQSDACNRWFWFTDAALEEDGGGLGGFCHGFAWRLPLDDEDLYGPYKWPITVAEYACFYAATVMYTPIVPDTDDALLCSDSLGSVDAVIDMRSKSGLMQMVTQEIRDLPEFLSIQHRLSVAHTYGAGNVFADAESRSKDDVIRHLVAQLRVSYRPLPMDPRVVSLAERIRARIRLVVDVRAGKRALRDSDESLGPESPACDAADGPWDSESESDSDAPPPLYEAHTPATRLPHSPVSARSDSPASPTPGAFPTAFRAAIPASPDSDGGRLSPPPHYTASGASMELPKPIAQVGTARAVSAACAAVKREASAAPTHQCIPSSSLDAMCDTILRDESAFALHPRDMERLRGYAARGTKLASRAVPDNTQRVNSGGWKWWNAFLADMFVGAAPLRDDPACARGDVAALKREAWLQAMFFIWLHPRMRARCRKGKKARKCSKPQSALNVVGAVRRIHKRAGCPLPPAPMLGEILKGMNDEYVLLHGDKRSLLPDRKEPLTNELTEKMFGVRTNTQLACGTINWNDGEWLALEAYVKSSRYTGWRKADALSQQAALAAFDLTRDDLSWYLKDGFNYRRVLQLPAGYVLRPGDCAVLNPGGAKNDQQMQEFGTQPMYLPYIDNDPNNPCETLQRMEQNMPCSNRKAAPLFAVAAGGAPLLPARADEMFSQLAVFALGRDQASRISLHSCRTQLACALKASGCEDPKIQAFARWKTPESVNIYGRFNPEDYAMWMRRAAAARTSSSQVTNLCQLDDDEAHVDMDAIINTVQSPNFEDNCEPECDPDDNDEADDGDTDDRDESQPTVHVAPPKRGAVRRVDDNAPITVGQLNPKRQGTLSYSRYEGYKAATSKRQYRELGGTAADFAHDVARGFVVIG